MLSVRFLVSVSLGAVFAAIAAPAWAARVAVLPFPPGDARAQSATQAAVVAQKHEPPSPIDISAGTSAVKDGQADTTDEYRAYGTAANVEWTVRGTSVHRADGYRIELEVCQVKTGRVELLAREIDETRETAQIGEMLALLLRPEGIANAELPWQNQKATPLGKPVEPPKAPEPAGPPPVAHGYAEGHPLGLAATLGVLSIVSRPPNATGPSTSVYLGGTAAYHVESIPGLELRGNVAGTLAGPRAFLLDVGARYAIGLLPTRRLFLVPDAGLGTFVTLGATKEARFWVRGAAFLSLGLGERVAVEMGPDLGVTPGGSGAVVLFGGTIRGFVRF